MDRRLAHIDKRGADLRFSWRRFSTVALTLAGFAVAFWHFGRPAAIYKTIVFCAILLFILYETWQAGWYRVERRSVDKLFSMEDLATLGIAVITASSFLIGAMIYYWLYGLLSFGTASALAIAVSLIMFGGGCWLFNRLLKDLRKTK